MNNLTITRNMPPWYTHSFTHTWVTLSPTRGPSTQGRSSYRCERTEAEQFVLMSIQGWYPPAQLLSGRCHQTANDVSLWGEEWGDAEHQKTGQYSGLLQLSAICKCCIILFTYLLLGCTGFTAAWGLSLTGEQGLLSYCGAQVLGCAGSSTSGTQAQQLQFVGSRAWPQ